MLDAPITNSNFAAIFPIRKQPFIPAEKDRLKVRPWCCYEMKVETSSFYGKPFNYLYVPRGAKTWSPKKMTSEFYNHELLTCDTTDEDQVVSFVEEYGIPFSPFYNSKERFLSGQYASPANPVPSNGITSTEEMRIELTKTGNDFPFQYDNFDGFVQDNVDSDDPHFYVRQRLIRAEVKTFIDARYLHRDNSSDALFGCYASEIARHNCYAKDPEYKKYGGIISIPEIQTTLRIYQMMFPLIAMSQYAQDNAIFAEDVVRYFMNKKFVQQNGPRYFFYDKKSPDEADDITLKSAEDLTNLGEKWFSEDYFYTLEDAVKAAQVCYLIDLKDAIENALNRATYFFEVSSRFILNQNRSLLSQPYYHQHTLKKSALSLLKKFLNSTDVEDEILKNGEAGSLDEALYSQFLLALRSDLPWKKCEHCGKIFKFYKETDLYNARSLRNSTCCKRSCSTMAGAKKK